MDYSKLNGKIREVYKTQKAFGEAMDMSVSAVNLRLNGKTQWTSPEIVKACEVLNIPLEDAHAYFFTAKSLENQN
jgi:hypothetical protein